MRFLFYVQPAPIRIVVPAALSIAAQLPMLIYGRSLNGNWRIKICASTIFIRQFPLAELFDEKYKFIVDKFV